MFGRRTFLAVLISLLAAVALGLSAYLTWVTWQSGTVAGCTGDSVFECDEVLTSRWSKWLGLPVSLLGAGTYLAILGLVWPAAGQPRGSASTGLFAVSLLAAGAAMWFIGLQVLQVESYCSYCLMVHGCGMAICVLSLLLFLDGSGGTQVDQARSLLGVAGMDDTPAFDEPAEPLSVASLLTALAISAVGLVVLMGGQLLVEPAEVMAMEEFDFDASDSSDSASAEQPEATQQSEAADAEQQVATAKDEPQTESPTANADLADSSSDDQDNDKSDDDWLEGEPESMPAEFLEEPTTIGSIFDTETSLTPGTIRFKALREPIDPNNMPVLGNPNAPHIIVEMMDYTCSHCRKLHPHLKAAVERYGDQIGVVVYNVPLSKKCNPNISRDYPGKKNACDYAQLSIGMWKLAPEEYAEFHDWLLKGKRPPSIVKAKQRARDLAGDEILLDKDLKADNSRRISQQVEGFNRLNSGLPVLLLPSGALRGVPATSEKMFEFLESKFDIKPKS